MELYRNEISGQGIMYNGRGIRLFPPGYLVRFGPPIGNKPIGAWEVCLDTYYNDNFCYSDDHRFTSQEEALSFLSSILQEPIELETAEERNLRQKGAYQEALAQAEKEGK